jgi:hypothetical protein
MTLELSHEAEQIIREFVEEVGRKINELGFKMDVKRKNEILSNIETYFWLCSIKLARKREANIVDAVDTRKALRRVNPTMVIKHTLMNPQTFTYVEDLEAKYLNLVKNKLALRH